MLTGNPPETAANKKSPRQSASCRGLFVMTDKWSRPVSRVLSRTIIPLGPPSPAGSSDLPGSRAGRAYGTLFGLAPGGVCRTGLLPDSWCALTAPFHPCHALPKKPFGGLLSVALSVGSRRPGVTWHPALWSPDFPPPYCYGSDRPADSGAEGRHVQPRRQAKAAVIATAQEHFPALFAKNRHPGEGRGPYGIELS